MKIAGFGVEEWLNVHEREAKYDLAQSTITSFTMNELKELTKADSLYDQLDEQKMNYGWIEGSPTFKQEISKMYQNVDSDNILQTNGATGANMLAIYSLIEPGDHVISVYPSYQQLYDIPKSLGAEVSFWKLREDKNWYPDIDELKRLIRPNTKMICINNANNPTGTILDRKFLEQVVEIARSVGAYILVDEVYLPFDESVDFAPIVDLYEKGISTNSLSKTYSMPGIRVGWTATNSELADIFRKYRDYTMICSGVFSDQMACLVLENKDKVLDRNKKIVLDNLAYFKDWVEKTPKVSCVFPNGVSTSFVKLDTKKSSQEFCQDLLKDTGVLLVPGEAFDVPGYARLGYCAPHETLTKGLEILGEYLQDN
ncbi:aminotransferase [Companilactobacillus kimchiensis]|uniref:Aminotransferase n=1 Tax=Companilactobacillus kimchiensis TaxID=993692 RepID=A0A0R2LLF0_9LACO|nr:aminotransferase [Companilactobacillus kimchiensis]KRN99735.1 transaminase [Companilactobacillus kimchiensis]